MGTVRLPKLSSNLLKQIFRELPGAGPADWLPVRKLAKSLRLTESPELDEALQVLVDLKLAQRKADALSIALTPLGQLRARKLLVVVPRKATRPAKPPSPPLPPPARREDLIDRIGRAALEAANSIGLGDSLDRRELERQRRRAAGQAALHVLKTTIGM